ncbi:Acetyltransferase [Colletotrichum viniferum]|nr:Acetyltransferase [Colletotrichum viniferum]
MVWRTTHYPGGLVISQIKSTEALEFWTPSLSDILQSCVNLDSETSSIGFRAPLSEEDASAYWTSLSSDISGTDPSVYLFVVKDPAKSNDNNTLATFQLGQNPKETDKHKIEVRRLLVHPAQRGGGIGRKLMNFAETFARDGLGKTMMLLETASDTPARGFNLKLGYAEWSVCPAYAQNALGRLHDCSFFLKMLQPTGQGVVSED